MSVLILKKVRVVCEQGGTREEEEIRQWSKLSQTDRQTEAVPPCWCSFLTLIARNSSVP